MNFFEDRPPHRPDDDEPPPAMPEWFGPPDDVLGGVVPQSAVLARTEHLFAGLTTLTAYPTGLLISLVLAARRQELPRERWEAVEAAFWAEHGHRPGRPHAGDGVLRLGVELADGRRTETQDPFPPAFDVPREPPVLVEHRGEGSGGSHRQDKQINLWLWPLPDGEAMTLVLQWPDLDLPLTFRRVELGPVREALARVEPYWP
jgi:hypothetical protein